MLAQVQAASLLRASALEGASSLVPEGTAADDPHLRVRDLPLEHPPPVGGRLIRYARAWSRISPGAWVLGVVTRGYKIEFTSPPPLHCLQKETVLPLDVDQRQSLLSEIVELQSKEAIFPVSPLYGVSGPVSLWHRRKVEIGGLS